MLFRRRAVGVSLAQLTQFFEAANKARGAHSGRLGKGVELMLYFDLSFRY